MDLMLQLTIALIGLPIALLMAYRTKTLANPATILFLAFFTPLFFSTFRLSGLQSNHWHDHTYITLLTTFGAWLIYPSIVLLAFYKPNPEQAPTTIDESKYTTYSRYFATLVIGAYFLGNLIQAKTLLPILHAEIAFDVHADFPGGIRFFARATPAAAILCYISFYKYRKKLDLFLMALAIATPLTRLSRIDPALSLFGLACLYPILPIFKIDAKRAAIIGLAALSLLIGGAELGTQRQNRFGQYDFKYAEMINWRPRTTGPSEILPVLYGYTSLSFENLDASISAHKGNYTVALYSFDWLFSGFVKLNWITPYERAQAENSQREIIATAATVPTALLPFFSDFGPIGIAVPLLIYVTIWIYFYISAKNSLLYASVFGIYSGAFALSSFQAQVASGPIAQQLVWAALIFTASKSKTHLPNIRGRHGSEKQQF